MKNLIKIRAILSSLLIIVFMVVVFTGVGLYLAPSGKIARATNWSFLGFDKWQLENLHTLSGFIMTGMIIIHLLINHKMFFSEVKALFGK